MEPSKNINDENELDPNSKNLFETDPDVIIDEDDGEIN